MTKNVGREYEDMLIDTTKTPTVGWTSDWRSNELKSAWVIFISVSFVTRNMRVPRSALIHQALSPSTAPKSRTVGVIGSYFEGDLPSSMNHFANVISVNLKKKILNVLMMNIAVENMINIRRIKTLLFLIYESQTIGINPLRQNHPQWKWWLFNELMF